jgi:Mg2+/Co2+ transporter CorB
VFIDDLNNVIGILHLRNCSKFLLSGEEKVTIEAIRKHTREPYFIPESTPLNAQLLYFQKEKRRIAIVVDEYGEVQGIITLEDLLEEIVGEFTTNLANDDIEILPQDDGSFIVDGGTQIRGINRTLDWSLPISGPKTLNGLLLEYLESIPDNQVGFKIGDYYFETLEIKDNKIQSAKISYKEKKRS